MTIVVISVPNSMLIWQQPHQQELAGAIAWDSRIRPSLFTLGFVYLLTVPYFAFAKMTSISDKIETRRINHAQLLEPLLIIQLRSSQFLLVLVF